MCNKNQSPNFFDLFRQVCSSNADLRRLGVSVPSSADITATTKSHLGDDLSNDYQ
ncbi:MAG: hypothetical protein ACFFC7_11015 [Candidatus Hermodarchaeota archaeon]